MTAWTTDSTVADAQLQRAARAQEWLGANGGLGRSKKHRAVRAERDRACYYARRAGATLGDIAQALGKGEAYAEERFWAGHKLVKGSA